MYFSSITSGSLSQAGLVLDIIGAYFLAQGFIQKRPEDVVKETSSYWGGNPFLLRSVISQRIEARVGFIFLLFGFMGQFLSYAGAFASSDYRVAGELVSFGIIVWVIAIEIVKKISNRLAIKAVLARFGQTFTDAITNAVQTKNDSEIEKLTQYYGGILNIPCQKYENVKSHAERILGFIKEQS